MKRLVVLITCLVALVGCTGKKSIISNTTPTNLVFTIDDQTVTAIMHDSTTIVDITSLDPESGQMFGVEREHYLVFYVFESKQDKREHFNSRMSQLSKGHLLLTNKYFGRSNNCVAATLHYSPDHCVVQRNLFFSIAPGYTIRAYASVDPGQYKMHYEDWERTEFTIEQAKWAINFAKSIDRSFTVWASNENPLVLRSPLRGDLR